MAEGDLTDLATVKARLWPGGGPATYDALLADLITEQSAAIAAARGFDFIEETYTHYIDGSGSELLVLPEGPLVSVTSVKEIEYQDDDGDGDRDETETDVDPHLYVECGLLADGYKARGWLERVDGCVWAKGRKNYQVAYTAGWESASVPTDIKDLATREVVIEFALRDSLGFETAQIGDFRAGLIKDTNREAARYRRLKPYMDHRVG